MIFGGHEISNKSLRKSFTVLSDAAGINQKLIENIGCQLDVVEDNICMGTGMGCGKSISALTDKSVNIDAHHLLDLTAKISEDLDNFKRKYNLRTVIVVNLASTEPPVPPGDHIETLEGFEKSLQNDQKDLIQASMLYAYVAFKSGFPFINFTASHGASIPALLELARAQKVPHAGKDGKTGETLIKAVLSLAFKYRVLRVLSWQGYNILGNLDGKVLDNPNNKKSKVNTKDGVLPQILGYRPHTHVGIDYVPSLSDWKVAWDFIHFEGFLGTKMNLQFTWQGCDSILAAPLVLDLVRLVELAHRNGDSGALVHLALFFKQPLGTDVASLPEQWDLLWNYLKKVKEV